MNNESKQWIYSMFSVMTEDECIDFLEELYRTGFNDCADNNGFDFEDSIKWVLADNSEIESRIRKR